MSASPTASLQISEESPATLDVAPLVDLWNAAFRDAKATSARLLEWAIRPTAYRRTNVVLASANRTPVGFAVAGLSEGDGLGRIDGLAVQPGTGRLGVRGALLAAAEGWLAAQGAAAVGVGGGARSLLRGLPPAQSASRFWAARDYQPAPGGPVDDLRADVARYTPPEAPGPFPGVVRPAQRRDVDNVLALLHDSAQVRLNGGQAAPAFVLALLRPLLERGRVADLMLLWTDNGVQGVAQLVFPDSEVPVELGYPYNLPRPWALLRALALAPDLPDAAPHLLLDACLRRLHNTGINSCVALNVATTTRYTPFGFRPYRRWRPLYKPLA